MTPAASADGGKTAALAGVGTDRRSRLSPPAMRTFFAQRAVFGSPLFLGGTPESYGAAEDAIVTDAVALEANAHGVSPRLAVRRDRVEVWIADDPRAPGCGWAAVFNRGASEVGFPSADATPGKASKYALKHAFGETRATSTPEVLRIGAGDVALFRFEPR